MNKADQIESRMAELMAPLDHQLLICDGMHDELMFACAMMQRCKEIFDSHLGADGRKRMFRDLT